jgi:hypothetical protein
MEIDYKYNYNVCMKYYLYINNYIYDNNNKIELVEYNHYIVIRFIKTIILYYNVMKI